jgi:hypothetical protein
MIAQENTSQDDVLSILQENGCYWMVNWKMVQFFQSFEEAVILAYLCSLQSYWTTHKQLKYGGYFYCTVETMREQTTIEPRKQKKAIRNLQSLELVNCIYKDLPQKRYFKINTPKLKQLLVLNSKSEETNSEYERTF